MLYLYHRSDYVSDVDLHTLVTLSWSRAGWGGGGGNVDKGRHVDMEGVAGNNDLRV